MLVDASWKFEKWRRARFRAAVCGEGDSTLYGFSGGIVIGWCPGESNWQYCYWREVWSPSISIRHLLLSVR